MEPRENRSAVRLRAFEFEVCLRLRDGCSQFVQQQVDAQVRRYGIKAAEWNDADPMIRCSCVMPVN